jgi:ribosomal protein L28
VELTADHVLAVRSTLDKYISGMISYQDTAMILAPITRTTQAIDKIERILRTPATPLPNVPSIPRRDEKRAKTRPWSQYEDQRLIAGIHRIGFGDWQAIAAFVGNNRSKSQCFQRWTRGLDPNINKTKWTPEQDSRLMMLVSLYGCKAWSTISQEFGNRCDVQCRYRYKQLRKESNFEELRKEAQEAAKHYVKCPEFRLHQFRQKQVLRPVEFAPPVQYRYEVPGTPMSVVHLIHPASGYVLPANCQAFHPVEFLPQPPIGGHIPNPALLSQSSSCTFGYAPTLPKVAVRPTGSVTYLSPFY